MAFEESGSMWLLEKCVDVNLSQQLNDEQMT